MTWKRVATAAALVPLVVALVLWAPKNLLAASLAAVVVLALVEFFAIGEQIGHRGYRLWTCTCSAILIFALANAASPNAESFLTPQGAASHLLLQHPLITSLFLFILGLMVLTLGTRRPLVEYLPSLGISSSGFLLIALPMSFAIDLEPRLLLFTLVLVWAGDTAAYFVGRSLGRWKMAPKLSPNKTWEGALASMMASLLVGWIFTRWTGLELHRMLVAAALGNSAGQMGDLLESAYKRSAGVKDSGSLLPGHGGMLDRIDALIFAVPVVWYYLKLVL
jgi:phosphatidate cytidylyltransferase